MAHRVRVAEIKRRFAEVLGRVRYRGERYMIMRREEPMAAIVGVDDLRRLEMQNDRPGGTPGPGLLAAIGAWEEFENLDQVIEEIYRAREIAVDRSVPLPS